MRGNPPATYCAKTPAEEVPDGGFGTNGTIGTACLITADEIRSRLTWITQRLEHKRDPDRARSNAFAILKAELLNDQRFEPAATSSGCCVVCGAIGTADQVLLPVLTTTPNSMLWVHSAPCHFQLLARRSQEGEQVLFEVCGYCSVGDVQPLYDVLVTDTLSPGLENEAEPTSGR